MSDPLTPLPSCLAQADGDSAPLESRSVEDLLRISRQQNLLRKRLSGRADKHGIITQGPDYANAERATALALSARLEAHLLDPEHTDPAWTFDAAPHTEILKFFVKYLTTDVRTSAWAELGLSEEAKSHICNVLGVEALPE